MHGKYGLISAIAGAISLFMFTFIAGIISLITAFLGIRAVSDGNDSIKSRKNIYFCILGLILTSLAFLIYSYIF